MRQSENAELPLALFSLLWKANLLTFEFVVQQLEFTLAVGKCWGFCWSIFMFYSICLCKNNAEAIKFLGLIKNTFPRIIKKKRFKKEVLWLIKNNYFCFSHDFQTWLHNADPLLYYPCMFIFSFHTFVILWYQFARNGT